ncbi:hypothetical protein C4J81_18510 [Deltaproteobacteria bacterium Smac51]|nr:hypothetical protein C4J81_18510 [Deltaproteobacteria bacterium Smac51]
MGCESGVALKMKKVSNPLKLLGLLMAAMIFGGGCAGAVRSVVKSPEAIAEVSVSEIRRHLHNGDWLVIRGVTAADNLVTMATNMPLSHAAIYDLENDQVIEADGSGVHVTPLADFVAKAQRLLVIRPVWSGPETSAAAVARARSWLGSGYNFTGLVGLSVPNRYYCTQLAIRAYEPFMADMPNPVPLVIAPGQMYHWGRIMFDTGPGHRPSR